MWLSRVAFLLWSSVQRSRDRGFLVILRVPSNLYVHGSMGRVNGCVGLAIKSPKCVMRNVDAHTERKRERGRARERPSYLLRRLPPDFSSLYQQPSQSAARGKINFLLPDYIIGFRLECLLNILYQHSCWV